MIEKNEQNKLQIINFMKKFIFDNNIQVKSLSEEELINEIYNDMLEYSFLTEYLQSNNVEEININSWEDIEIIFRDGRSEKTIKTFLSPQHAEDIIKRMLNHSGKILDNKTPCQLGHLGSNIRIAAIKTPIVDKEVGVCASIRIVKSIALSRENLIESGTLSEEILDFLEIINKNEVSFCICGSTSSGKTTLAQYFLDKRPNEKRLYTIEEGSRELNSIKRSENGKIINSVIHTLTRLSEEDEANVDQKKLLEFALRFHPNSIVIAEMRSGAEAYFGQEASRTGHHMITTVHSQNCRGGIRRIMTLAKQESDLDKETLIEQIIEAFPIVLHQKQYPDKKRRTTEVMECYIDENEKIQYNTLFRFEVTENYIDENGNHIINGKHKKVNSISKNLVRTLINNGATISEIEKIGGDIKNA